MIGKMLYSPVRVTSWPSYERTHTAHYVIEYHSQSFLSRRQPPERSFFFW